MSFIVIRAVIYLWVHLAQWIYKINASQENSVICLIIRTFSCNTSYIVVLCLKG